MGKTLNITILCGGQSAEHEVSIKSARNVAAALDLKKYSPQVIYITSQGAWYLMKDVQAFIQEHPQNLIKKEQAEPITIALGDKQTPFLSLKNDGLKYGTDCVFPLVHGTKGEDGALQGLLEMIELPYVGAGVLGSAIGMDKHVAKELLRYANLPTTNWITLRESEIADYSYTKVVKLLGSPFFVKPVTLGSSVGITKVKEASEYPAALASAFEYDERIMIETAVPGREIECSVLGNTDPVASLPAEIIPALQHEFYSYSAKYLDSDSQVICPANLSPSQIKTVQDLSIKAFKVLQCLGMARVDFFVDGEKVVINELNSIPGFTNISAYPKNWIVSGIEYSDLIHNLIQLALNRYRQQQAIKRFYEHKEDAKKSRELNGRPTP